MANFQSNQNIELYSWYNVDLKQTLTIRAHSRSITDLDWCHTDASLLLSSSVDDFFHVWDLREPRKPSLSFQVVGKSTSTVIHISHVTQFLTFIEF